MKLKLKSPRTYLFSVIPMVALFGLLGLSSPAGKKVVGTNGNTPNDVLNKTLTYNPFIDVSVLPCGYPNHGYVISQTPQITTNPNKALLVYPANFLGGTTDNIGSVGGGTSNLRLQSDGNLVLYELISGTWKACWSSGTQGSGAVSLWFQTDGNLVLYNSIHQFVWGSMIHSTCTSSDQAFFVLQSDGNLVMRYYAGRPYGGTTNYDYALGDTNTALGHVSSHQGTIQ